MKKILLFCSAALVSLAGGIGAGVLYEQSQSTPIKVEAAQVKLPDKTVIKKSAELPKIPLKIEKEAKDLSDNQTPDPQELSSNSSVTPPTSSTASVDLPALASGNISSLLGTWTNGFGKTITFEKDRINKPTFHGIEQGVLKGSYESAAFQVLPAGISGNITISDGGPTIQDKSEQNRDRLLWSQSAIDLENPQSFYYRISN